MKQSQKLNKAIKRAIKAAHAERQEMEKQRDIWERAIQEKVRQIDTLNSMLTPRKLAFSIEVEDSFEKDWQRFVNQHEQKKGNVEGLQDIKEKIKAFEQGEEVEISVSMYGKEAYNFSHWLEYKWLTKIIHNGEVKDIAYSLTGVRCTASNRHLFFKNPNKVQKVKEEKPFDEVWEEFLMTLSPSLKSDTDIIRKGYEWCISFYDYQPINIEALTLAYERSRDYIEQHIFAPFLKHINIEQLKIDGKIIDIVIQGFIKIASNQKYLIVHDDDYETFQRIKPTK